MAKYIIDISSDKDELAIKASDFIQKQIEDILTKKDRVKVALCGGSTPANTYSLLGEKDIPWNQVDVFLGDERWVDHSSSKSNALMIRQTLLSKRYGSKSTFYPIPTTEYSSPIQSAKEYANFLGLLFKGEIPAFDLILLGLGEDGHTASLFPGSSALNVSNEWTAIANGNGQERITLTSPLLCSAKKVIFLISGISKQKALGRLLDPEEPYQRTPAKLVQPNSDIYVLLDKDAALNL